MTDFSNMRDLNAREIDSVSGGAAPGQGHDPVPPPGTPAQPINLGSVVTTAVGGVAALPGALPGLLNGTAPSA